MDESQPIGYGIELFFPFSLIELQSFYVLSIVEQS